MKVAWLDLALKLTSSHVSNDRNQSEGQFRAAAALGGPRTNSGWRPAARSQVQTQDGSLGGALFGAQSMCSTTNSNELGSSLWPAMGYCVHNRVLGSFSLAVRHVLTYNSFRATIKPTSRAVVPSNEVASIAVQ